MIAPIHIKFLFSYLKLLFYYFLLRLACFWLHETCDWSNWPHSDVIVNQSMHALQYYETHAKSQHL